MIKNTQILWLSNEKDQIKNEAARVATTFSPLYPYGSYLLPWKQSSIPMMLHVKFDCIWVAEIFLFESVNGHTQG